MFPGKRHFIAAFLLIVLSLSNTVVAAQSFPDEGNVNSLYIPSLSGVRVEEPAHEADESPGSVQQGVPPYQAPITVDQVGWYTGIGYSREYLGEDQEGIATIAAVNDVFWNGNILGNSYLQFDIGDIRTPVRDLRYVESGAIQQTLTQLSDAGPLIDSRWLYNEDASRFTIISGIQRYDYAPWYSTFSRQIRYSYSGLTINLTQYWSIYWQKRSFQFSTNIQNVSNRNVSLQRYQIYPVCTTAFCTATGFNNLFTSKNDANTPAGVYREEIAANQYVFRRTFETRPMFFTRNNTDTQGFAVSLLSEQGSSGYVQAVVANHGYATYQPPEIDVFWGGAWSNIDTGMETPLTLAHNSSRYVAYTVAFWKGNFAQNYSQIWADLQQPYAPKAGSNLAGHIMFMEAGLLSDSDLRNTRIQKLADAGTKILVLQMPDYKDISHGISNSNGYYYWGNNDESVGWGSKTSVLPYLGEIVTTAHNKGIKVLLSFSLSGVLESTTADPTCNRNNGNIDRLRAVNPSWRLLEGSTPVVYWFGCYARMDPFQSNAWYQWVVNKVTYDLAWNNSAIDGFYFDEPTIHGLRHWSSSGGKTVTAKYIDLLGQVSGIIRNANKLVLINDRMPMGQAFYYADYMFHEGIPPNNTLKSQNYLFWAKPAGHAASNGWSTCTDSNHNPCSYPPSLANVNLAVMECNNHGIEIGGGAHFSWYTNNLTDWQYIQTLYSHRNCP